MSDDESIWPPSLQQQDSSEKHITTSSQNWESKRPYGTACYGHGILCVSLSLDGRAGSQVFCAWDRRANSSLRQLLSLYTELKAFVMLSCNIPLFPNTKRPWLAAMNKNKLTQIRNVSFASFPRCAFLKLHTNCRFQKEAKTICCRRV